MLTHDHPEFVKVSPIHIANKNKQSVAINLLLKYMSKIHRKNLEMLKDICSDLMEYEYFLDYYLSI